MWNIILHFLYYFGEHISHKWKLNHLFYSNENILSKLQISEKYYLVKIDSIFQDLLRSFNLLEYPLRN